MVVLDPHARPQRTAPGRPYLDIQYFLASDIDIGIEYSKTVLFKGLTVQPSAGKGPELKQ